MDEEFDFTSEGEGCITLDEARILAIQTAIQNLVSVAGDIGTR